MTAQQKKLVEAAQRLIPDRPYQEAVDLGRTAEWWREAFERLYANSRPTWIDTVAERIVAEWPKWETIARHHLDQDKEESLFVCVRNCIAHAWARHSQGEGKNGV